MCVHPMSSKLSSLGLSCDAILAESTVATSAKPGCVCKLGLESNSTCFLRVIYLARIHNHYVLPTHVVDETRSVIVISTAPDSSRLPVARLPRTVFLSVGSVFGRFAARFRAVS